MKKPIESGQAPLGRLRRLDPAGSETVIALPQGRATNRTEAICSLPPALAGGKASWLVLYDAPGAGRKEGEYTVFGDLLHHR